MDTEIFIHETKCIGIHASLPKSSTAFQPILLKISFPNHHIIKYHVQRSNFMISIKDYRGPFLNTASIIAFSISGLGFHRYSFLLHFFAKRWRASTTLRNSCFSGTGVRESITKITSFSLSIGSIFPSESKDGFYPKKWT